MSIPGAIAPLPKRLRRQRGDVSDTATLDTEVLSPQSKVQQNILARSKIIRAKTSLETQDGCAGEYYEYLDHTADVQFHVWGDSFERAVEHMSLCMFNYITDLSTIRIDPAETVLFSIAGHDMQSLLFKFMDELLFRFSAEGFCCAKLTVLSFKRKEFTLSLKAEGERFDATRHPQGTEIKAITYSNMQIHELPQKTELYVIVDI